MARSLIGADDFIEVYVNASIETCEQRDVKGLYKQARAGKIPNMTGINSPYEAPDSAEYEADTNVNLVENIVLDLFNIVTERFTTDQQNPTA
jgi:adenylylsulfate kinase-like enzyme